MALDETIVRTEALIRLCSVLFQEWCDSNLTTQEESSRLSPVDFIMWVRENLEYRTTPQIADICLKADVTEPTWEQFLAYVDDPVGANRLAAIWPQVTLAWRGKPANEVSSLHVLGLLKWADGRSLPLSCFVPSEIANSRGVLDDGAVCTLLQINAHNLSDIVVEQSLDTLYTQASNNTTESDFHVMMGLMLQVLRGDLLLVSKNSQKPVQIDSVRLPGCLAIVRLLQFMYAPPIPKFVQGYIDQFHAERTAAAEQAAAPDQPKQTGGWAG